MTGLVPRTLKDIAWPDRRVVVVSRYYVEVIVRALEVVLFTKELIKEEEQPMSSTARLYK